GDGPAPPLELLRDARRPGEEVECSARAGGGEHLAEHRHESALRAEVLDHAGSKVDGERPRLRRCPKIRTHGGAKARCTRATLARTATRTATASVTCPGSSSSSTICSGSASGASGSAR